MKFIQDEINNINAELAKLDERDSQVKSLETAKNTLRWVLDPKQVSSPIERYKYNYCRSPKSNLPNLEAVIAAYLTSQGKHDH